MLSFKDEPIKEDTAECLEDIRKWWWYDNYQHGYYVDENKCGYGKIVVFNSRVDIITHNLKPTEDDEKYKKVWGHYEYWHTRFTGDLSERRQNYLIELSKRPEVIKVNVNSENGYHVFSIVDGEVVRQGDSDE